MPLFAAGQKFTEIQTYLNIDTQHETSNLLWLRLHQEVCQPLGQKGTTPRQKECMPNLGYETSICGTGGLKTTHVKP